MEAFTCAYFWDELVAPPSQHDPWEVVEAKAGKGSATLSMAYSGARFGNKVRHETFSIFVLFYWNDIRPMLEGGIWRETICWGTFWFWRKHNFRVLKKEGEQDGGKVVQAFWRDFFSTTQSSWKFLQSPFLILWPVIRNPNHKHIDCQHFFILPCDTSYPGPGRYGRNAHRRVCLCCFVSHGFAVLLLQGWMGNQKWPWQYWLQVISETFQC